MFLFLENLVQTEDTKEELLLIPNPQYIKIIDSPKMKINEFSKRGIKKPLISS